MIREGHIGFEDLYGKYISHSVVIASLKKICVSDKYLKIVEELLEEFIPVTEIADKCIFVSTIWNFLNTYKFHKIDKFSFIKLKN